MSWPMERASQESHGGGGAAKETHWFGLGRTPHPIQAGNIWSVCLLKQKKAGKGPKCFCSHGALSIKRGPKKPQKG